MKIWVLTGKPSYGGTKKLIHGFTTEAEARRIVEIIDACDPRLTLDLEEIEVDGSAPPVPPSNPQAPGQWLNQFMVAGDHQIPEPSVTGLDLAEPRFDRTVVVSHSEDGVKFTELSNPGSDFEIISVKDAGITAAVTYEEPMPHMIARP